MLGVHQWCRCLMNTSVHAPVRHCSATVACACSRKNSNATLRSHSAWRVQLGLVDVSENGWSAQEPLCIANCLQGLVRVAGNT